MKYKALTLTQPWATLIALGQKKIETRSWATQYRGPLLIHAAKGLGAVGGARGLRQLINDEPFFTTLAEGMEFTPSRSLVDTIIDSLPFGALVAACQLHHCRTTIPEAAPGKRGWSGYVGNKLTYWDLTDQERAFGDYTPGRYAWLLDDIRALDEPMAARGAQGLWEWEGELP